MLIYLEIAQNISQNIASAFHLEERKSHFTYPLRTPRTRFNIKKDPTTISGIKKTQLKTTPRASLV